VPLTNHSWIAIVSADVGAEEPVCSPPFVKASATAAPEITRKARVLAPTMAHFVKYQRSVDRSSSSGAPAFSAELPVFKGIEWRYTLADGIDPSALTVPQKSSQKSHYTPLAPWKG
jgi:hypothetical protein